MAENGTGQLYAQCEVFGCKSTNNIESSTKPSFHKFPSNQKRREQWIAEIKRTRPSWDGKLTYLSAVCGKHFRPESFQDGPVLMSSFGIPQHRRKRLKTDAVPVTTCGTVILNARFLGTLWTAWSSDTAVTIPLAGDQLGLLGESIQNPSDDASQDKNVSQIEDMKDQSASVQISQETFIIPDELPDSSTEDVCKEENVVSETGKIKHRTRRKVPMPPRENVCSEVKGLSSIDAIKSEENSQFVDVEGRNDSVRPLQEAFILPDKLPPDGSTEVIGEEEDEISKTENSKRLTKIKAPLPPKENVHEVMGQPSNDANKNQENSQIDVEGLSAFVRRLQETFILPDQLSDISTKDICQDVFPITEPIKHRRVTKPCPPPKEKFQCSVCSLKFTRKYQLNRHMQMMPCSGQPTPGHKCSFCGKVYKRKDNLTFHLRSHTGEPRYVRKMNHTCSYCGKQYHHIATLEIHVRKHTGEKPFPCDLCEKRFPSNGQLTVHWRKHTGEKPYSCKVCGQRFGQNSSLKRHMLRRCATPLPHNLTILQESANSDEKQANENESTNNHVPNDDSSACASKQNDHGDSFSCKMCRKSFNTSESLQKHPCTVLEPNSNFSDIKKELKPHQCTICFKRYSRKNSLTVHVLTHNKEKPSACDQCGKDFIRKDCLRRDVNRTYCKCESILPD